MSPTVIIGLGNLYMSDEGIGVRVAMALAQDPRVPAGVEVMDLGTAGFAVLHALEGRTRAVFVDCAFMGEEPGTFRRFTPDEVDSRKVETRWSLHEGDLLRTLDLARKLDQCPEEVVLIGVEPGSTDPGADLSPAVAACLPVCVGAVLNEVGA
jgi:hydrogenase maturation protease